MVDSCKILPGCEGRSPPAWKHWDEIWTFQLPRAVMLETSDLQIQKLLRHHLLLVVTLGVHWKGPVLLFLLTQYFCCTQVIPVEPSLALYSEARAQSLLQSLQKLGLEIRK